MHGTYVYAASAAYAFAVESLRRFRQCDDDVGGCVREIIARYGVTAHYPAGDYRTAIRCKGVAIGKDLVDRRPEPHRKQLFPSERVAGDG